MYKRILIAAVVLISITNRCPAYDVEPPVHQWIALQAYLKIADDPGEYASLVSEMQHYLPINPHDANYSLTFSPTGGWDDADNTNLYEDSTALIEGAWEEDKGLKPGGSSSDPRDRRVAEHFWNPEGQYNDGLFVPELFLDERSALQKAQEDLWDEAIGAYGANPARSYYLLGRIAHLLMDMSVPAHTLLDPHWADDDQYETFTGSNYSRIPYSAITPIPDISSLDPYPLYAPGDYDEDLTRLFYSLADKSNDFDSDDRDGESYEFGYGKYTIARNTLTQAKTLLHAQLWNTLTSSFVREMIQGRDYDVFDGCAGVSEYSIYYYREFYELVSSGPYSIKVFYTDGTDDTFMNWALESLADVPDSILECIYQPKLQAKAIVYVAALYRLFWDETHRNNVGSLSSPRVEPGLGDTNTSFQFKVTFTDTEGDPPDPDSVKLILGGTTYVMTTTDADYTDGSLFVYPPSGGVKLSAGSYQYYFEAKQGGEHVGGSPTTPERTLNVSPPSAGQVTVNLSPNPVEVFKPVTVTATVRDSGGTPLEGLTVNFSQNDFPGVMSPRSDLTNANGQATGTFTPNASGTALITAQVSGGPSGSKYLTVNPGKLTFELSFYPAPSGGNAYNLQAKLLSNGGPWPGENVTLTLSPSSMAYFNRTSSATFPTTTNAGGYAQDGDSSVVDVTTTGYGILTVTARHNGTGVTSSLTTNIQEGGGATFEAFRDLGYSGVDVDWSGDGTLVAIKDPGSYTYLIKGMLTTPALWNSVYTDCAGASGVVFSPNSKQMLVAGKGNAQEMAIITLDYPSGSPTIVTQKNDHGYIEDRACDWASNRILTGRTNDPECEVYDTSLNSVCASVFDMADDVTAVAFDQTTPSRFVFGDWNGIIKAGTTSCSVSWSASAGGGQITSAAWHGNNVVVGDNISVIHRYNATGSPQSDPTPDYVPHVIREFSTFCVVYCAGRGVAETEAIHAAANWAGVLYPKLLCGRWSLYSSRQLSASTFASLTL